MRALLAAPVAVLVLAGCGSTEDATQRFAREATESHLAGNDEYEPEDVHCTPNPTPWFVERQAGIVICAARRSEGGCDWFRIELVPVATGREARIRLDTENAGCVLPA